MPDCDRQGRLFPRYECARLWLLDEKPKQEALRPHAAKTLLEVEAEALPSHALQSLGEVWGIRPAQRSISGESVQLILVRETFCAWRVAPATITLHSQSIGWDHTQSRLRFSCLAYVDELRDRNNTVAVDRFDSRADLKKQRIINNLIRIFREIFRSEVETHPSDASTCGRGYCFRGVLWWRLQEPLPSLS